ncbi:Uncharacterized protein ACO02O_00436 [Dirofilaria immitis]
MIPIVLSIILIAFLQQLRFAQIAFLNEISYAIPQNQSVKVVEQSQSAQFLNDKELQEIVNEIISEQKLKRMRGRKQSIRKMLIKLLRSKIMKSKTLRVSTRQIRDLSKTILKLLRMVVPKLIG